MSRKLSDYHSSLSTSTLLVFSLLSACIQCHGAAATNQAGFPDFELFPFGFSAGDVRGPTGDDDASGPVTLEVPFTFIGTEYNRIYVSSNGVLSFNRSFTSHVPMAFPLHFPPLIAPFWHDFNPRIGGNIYYRQTNDYQQLQLFHAHLNLALNTTCRHLSDIFPTLLFIATWDQVPRFSGSAQVNNTLQVVLATDSVQTLAVFIYKDINWGEEAQIGFNLGDGYMSYTLPEAHSDQTHNIDERTNVGQPGVFVYRIDNFPCPEPFPFGVVAGDVRGPRGDNSASSPVNLEVPFTFIGKEYSQIVVNSNGVLSFEKSFTSCCGSRVFPRSSPPLIAPFWHDFDPTVGGNIYYRQTDNSQQLHLFHIRLRSALNNTTQVSDFFPTLLFIATWDQVPQYSGSAQVNNTFQVVLATDNEKTLAVFIYKDINWGERAQIGFNVGDGYTSFIFPEALSDQTYRINDYSNVGESGTFVYCINKIPLLKLSGVLPFGLNISDLSGPCGDDSASKPLILGVPFSFFGKKYSKIIMNSNGVLSFDLTFTNCCPPRDFPLISPPLIAPFWQDFDLTSTSKGGIYFRQTNDLTYLQLIHNILLMDARVTDNIGDLVDFLPTQLFIATWEQVPQSGGSASVNNTFQVLLSTDGIQTVAIFIYHDIRWGERAQIGFNAGDGYTSFTLPDALTELTLSIDQCSNVGEPGVFVYRIDVPPDQAYALTVESTEATSIHISWRPPTLPSLYVSYYLINANNLNNTDDIKQVNITNNITSFNVTGLLPGTTYELTIVAAFEEDSENITTHMSQPSSSVTATSGKTVPALTCNAPVSSNGVITVAWSYIHTGGLPLTNLYLQLIRGSDSKQLNAVSISSVDTTSIMFPNLVTGAEYMFNVTAENSYGSSSITCGPTPHIIGVPATPVFGHLISGPKGGEITLTIQSPASGIDTQISEVFWFVITPIHNGIERESIPHLSLNYQSSIFETIVIDELEEGESYIFNATAVNIYGSSLTAMSVLVLADASTTPTPKEEGRVPATPVFGHLISGPKRGAITLIVQCPASRIDTQFSEVFWFVITPIHDEIEGKSISHLSLNYQSGTFETIVIDGLEEGESYMFNATAVNIYGSSLTATSIPILADASATSRPKEEGSSSATNTIISIVGGAGGVGSIILLFMVLFVLIFIRVRRSQAKVSHLESILMNRVVNTRGDLEAKIDSEAVYEEPGELL